MKDSMPVSFPGKSAAETGRIFINGKCADTTPSGDVISGLECSVDYLSAQMLAVQPFDFLKRHPYKMPP